MSTARLTVAEAARIAGTSPKTIRHLIHVGVLHASQVDPRNPRSHYRISERALRAYMQQEAA